MNVEKLKRLPSFHILEREIISHVFRTIEKRPYNRWYKVNGEFKFKGTVYDFECECKTDYTMFMFKELLIHHKQIELNVEDVLTKGYLQQ